MRILVLGGTVFLSRAVAADAVARGHDVTCAARGASGSVPDGATLAVWDRAAGDPPADLAAAAYDAVVDVARHPSWVRRAVAAWPHAHWVLVSTINVYPDEVERGGSAATLPLREPRFDDADLAEEPEAYGPMKVACERTVLDAAASASVVRPGLVVGPGDPSGRFTYWPSRLAAAAERPEVLAPGDPADPMQVVDVRDLAAWLVDLAEQRRSLVVDGIGPAVPLGDLLAEVADGVGATPTWTWVPQEFLEEREVQPWAGPGSLPLWLPRPTYDGMRDHDAAPVLAAGLRPRPIAETARDTLAWLRADPAAPVTGLTPEEEAAILTAWRERS